MFKFLCSFFIYCCCFSLYAQNETVIDIINTNSLEYIKKGDEEIRKLIGAVQLQQGDLFFECDSAYIYERRNDIEAFGNVHIRQADSVNIYAQYLNYTHDRQRAYLYDKVRLVDSKSTITSDTLEYAINEQKAVLYQKVKVNDQQGRFSADSLTYFVKSKEAILHKNANMVSNEGYTLQSPRMRYNSNTRAAVFEGGGDLQLKDGAKVKSQQGQYDAAKKTMIFRQQVEVNHPDYRLVSDLLNYNIATETVDFQGNSTIYQKDATLSGERGVYNPATKTLSLKGKAYLSKPPQMIRADSLYLQQEGGIAYAYRQVELKDTSQKITVWSDFARFTEAENALLSSGKALLATESEGDTLWLAADTISTARHGTDSTRRIDAFRKVQIFKSDFQAVCDSLSFSSSDSLFRLYDLPAIWAENTQLSADTILLQLRGKHMEKALLRRNAMMLSENFKDIFDQAVGAEMDIAFERDSVHQLDMRGSAETIYFAQDDAKRFIGINHSKAERIKVVIQHNKPDKIYLYENPNSVFHPIKEYQKDTFRVNGFVWRNRQRPQRVFFVQYRIAQLY
ncbi:MAG: LPS export ABC transporter periplasmic protein LptC [Sphingobacteriales bacterium]|nr:LPS export ABC transporter periplasmic protein LptC [Sphingobacteriales bacterium]